jgi:hypothetical protein
MTDDVATATPLMMTDEQARRMRRLADRVATTINSGAESELLLLLAEVLLSDRQCRS